jgi:hypothetical protein
MANLGAFFGHIVKGIRTNPAAKPPSPPSAPPPVATRTREEVLTRDLPGARVTLRRTTTEELHVEPMEDRAAP